MMTFNRNKINLFIIFLLISISFSNELGIESFEKQKDGTYVADIYMLNDKPLAGFQLDLLPKGLFEIQAIYGGKGEALGFNMSAGNNGTMLGFSFTGAVIEPSKSIKPENNIIFTLSLKLLGKMDEMTEISFNSILAGRGGEKIPTTIKSFKPVQINPTKIKN